MDGGTAATATPSHIHHLESPFCHVLPSHLPLPTSHLMLIVASSLPFDSSAPTPTPLHRHHPTNAPQPHHRPPSIKSSAYTRGARLPAMAGVGSSADAGVGGEAMESISVGGERAKNGGDADEDRATTRSVSPWWPPGRQQTKQRCINVSTLMAISMAIMMRRYYTACIARWRRSRAFI
jgi:hypothetical protein